MTNLTRILLILAAIVIFLLLWERCEGDGSKQVTIPAKSGTLRVDTIVVTHTKIVPKVTERVEYKTVVQELILHKTDTAYVMYPAIDTIRTQNFEKTIENNDLKLRMFGVVTGRVDSIAADYTIKEQKVDVARPKRFGIGVSVGVGIDGKPYLGAGVNYNLIEF